jgi:hypothetical protein
MRTGRSHGTSSLVARLPHRHGCLQPSPPFLTPIFLFGAGACCADTWSGWFVRLGLKVAIADINVEALAALAKELGAVHGETNVISVPTDVSKLEDVVRLRERVYEAWGEVSVVRRGLPSPPPPLPLSLPPPPHFL